MKLRLNRWFLTVVFALGASRALPAWATSGTITGSVTLIKAQQFAVGNTFIELSATTTVGQCIKDGAKTMILLPDDDKGKQMYSMAEAALLAGKTLTAFVDDGGSSTYCAASYITISP